MVEVVGGARGLLDKGSSESEPKDTIIQHSSMYVLTTAEPQVSSILTHGVPI